MSDRLAPFVPQLAIELAAVEPPTWSSIEGSMLSADISGFTALSEKLAGKGKAGAEEITELINVCFTALIDAAYSFGGEVLKFGGDALLILFRGDRHQRRAADAGLRMQHVLHASPAAKRASLTMTVGVSDGPFDVFLVGSGYRELLVSGDRATEVIRLEGEAAKGDTIVSSSIAEHLPDHMMVRSEAGGYVVRGRTGDDASGPIPRDIGDHDLEPYVPRPVVEQLSAFESLGGEHRLVTVGFVMVTGVSAHLDSHGPTVTATALGAIVDTVVASCERYGVTALHTDIAPDGVKFVLCAGAPVSPGDTADALLQTALDIAATDSPFVIRQGVQTGRVFAGFLGSNVRRAYTLMGDPVNTAARMLGKAGDREIVAVEAVVEDTRAVFDTDAIEPFLVKGKAEPIAAHHVRRMTDRTRRDNAGTRLIGRRRELAVLSRAVGELDIVVQVIGPAGVGKSRLLDAAWDDAEGLSIQQASCTPYGAASPYSLFRPLLRTGTGMPADADGETVGRSLRELVEEVAPSLVPMLPLLAVPFGAEVANTAQVDALNPEYRRARMHDVVVEFLDAVVTRPLLLVAEDAQWIDGASAELFEHLVRAAATRPWSAVVSMRGDGRWRLDETIEHVTTLSLEPLDADDIRELALEVSTRALADAELDEIVQRSAGNPLYAVELSRALSQSDGGVPDTIEELIAARFDALPPDTRRLIRVASVFGNEFSADHLLAVTTNGDETLLERDDVGAVLSRRPDGRVMFQHSLFRDVAYEGLPFRQRRELHLRVARMLHDTTDDARSIAGLLSLHFAEGGQHRDSYRFSTLAAQDATAAFAQQEAAQYLGRALASGRYDRSVTALDRARLYEQLGQAHEFSGQLERAERAYRRVTTLTDDLDLSVDSLRRRGRVRQKQNRLGAATTMLRRALALLDDHDDRGWVHRRLAEIHLSLSGIRMDQARLDDALREARAAESHAARAGDDALRVQAYGAIVGATTDWSEAERYATLGLGPDAPGDAHEARFILATNLGMSAYFAGRWQRAVELYDIGRAAADSMGNTTGAAAAAMNAAEVLIDQGHLEQAIDVLGHARRVLEAGGYTTALLYAEMLLAVARTRRDPGAGIDQLESCATRFRSGSMLLYGLEAEMHLAEALLHTGSFEAAERLATGAIHDAPRVARRAVIEVRAHRLLGAVAERRDDERLAQEHLERAVETSRREDLPYELALSLAHLRVLGGGAPDAEADAIFADLGVVDPPMLIDALAGR